MLQHDRSPDQSAVSTSPLAATILKRFTWAATAVIAVAELNALPASAQIPTTSYPLQRFRGSRAVQFCIDKLEAHDMSRKQWKAIAEAKLPKLDAEGLSELNYIYLEMYEPNTPEYDSLKKRYIAINKATAKSLSSTATLDAAFESTWETSGCKRIHDKYANTE